MSDAPAADPANYVDLNLNETVRVKLTFDGLRILKEQHDELKKRAPKIADWRVPGTDKDGWSTFQLWTLMDRFGPHIHMGCPLPFAADIQIVRPAPRREEDGVADTITPSKKALIAKIRTLKAEMAAETKRDWTPVHHTYLAAILDAAAIHAATLPEVEQ